MPSRRFGPTPLQEGRGRPEKEWICGEKTQKRNRKDMKTYEITNIPKFLHLFFWGGFWQYWNKDIASPCQECNVPGWSPRLAESAWPRHIQSPGRQAWIGYTVDGYWYLIWWVDIFSRVLKDRRNTNSYWREWENTHGLLDWCEMHDAAITSSLEVQGFGGENK